MVSHLQVGELGLVGGMGRVRPTGTPCGVVGGVPLRHQIPDDGSFLSPGEWVHVAYSLSEGVVVDFDAGSLGGDSEVVERSLVTGDASEDAVAEGVLGCRTEPRSKR